MQCADCGCARYRTSHDAAAVVVAVVAGDWWWYCTAPPLPVRAVVVGNFWDLFIHLNLDNYLVDKSVDIHRC